MPELCQFHHYVFNTHDQCKFHTEQSIVKPILQIRETEVLEMRTWPEVWSWDWSPQSKHRGSQTTLQKTARTDMLVFQICKLLIDSCNFSLYFYRFISISKAKSLALSVSSSVLCVGFLHLFTSDLLRVECPSYKLVVVVHSACNPIIKSLLPVSFGNEAAVLHNIDRWSLKHICQH